MLNDVQFEHGGANFMVYGKYGRTEIYQVQELMRTINRQSQSMDDELYSANAIVDILPEKHWYNHFTFLDSRSWGNNGNYDLLLHKRDVSYSILELHMWLEKGSYSFVEFLGHEDRINLSLKGRKLKALKLLYNKLLRINICVEQSVSELIWGKVFKQDIFASKQLNFKINTTTNQNIADVNSYIITYEDYIIYPQT